MSEAIKDDIKNLREDIKTAAEDIKKETVDSVSEAGKSGIEYFNDLLERAQRFTSEKLEKAEDLINEWGE